MKSQDIMYTVLLEEGGEALAGFKHLTDARRFWNTLPESYVIREKVITVEWVTLDPEMLEDLEKWQNG